MSWYANTLFPTIEACFGHDDDNHGAPADPREGAAELRKMGHHDVADYVEKLTHQDYEDLLWQAVVAAVNSEHPSDSKHK